MKAKARLATQRKTKAAKTKAKTAATQPMVHGTAMPAVVPIEIPGGDFMPGSSIAPQDMDVTRTARREAMTRARETADAAVPNPGRPPRKFNGLWMYGYFTKWLKAYVIRHNIMQSRTENLCGRAVVGEACHQHSINACNRYHGCPLCLAVPRHEKGIFGCNKYLSRFPK